MSTLGGNSNATTARTNISVTSINCTSTISSTTASISIADMTPTENTISLVNSKNHSENSDPSTHTNSNHFYGNNGSIRISVPKMEESDESDSELSNIESSAAAAVNKRASINKNVAPRPMSWEGELSDHDDRMETDVVTSPVTMHVGDASAVSATETSIDDKVNVITFASNGSGNVTTTATPHTLDLSARQTIDNIKPELGDIGSVDVHKQFPLDMSNVKYENQQTSAYQIQQIQSDSVNSPLLARSKTSNFPPNPSPDSAIHSLYTHSSPSHSPLTSRHTPYTPSLSRNNSDASYSSCYSYSSEFSPTHSPIQGRHNMYSGNFNGSPLHHSIYKPMLDNGSSVVAGHATNNGIIVANNGNNNLPMTHSTEDNGTLEAESIPSAGISRQQLINSPCPICGDKISGFHYGIFSCESCKGFFKRTVQNRKNYVCLRGGPCPITIATRKKCPACRFEKCLQRGMKLEAIREDRTRGGRSTYQCSYTLPMLSPSLVDGTLLISNNRSKTANPNDSASTSGIANNKPSIPVLLQEIMDVEHLWKYSESEFGRQNENNSASQANNNGAGTSSSSTSAIASNPLLASAGLGSGEDSNPDLIANLCSVADHRLYKIVKWCKSLPLFKNISIDDQICLLINSWCELLLFSCCFRSISTPGEVRISLGKSINLEQAKLNGLQACIERMLNLTDHLRRLKVDKYEYVAMKVIVLLQSDTSDLRESEKVRACQEKALEALQAYTLAHYPEMPSKFGELLLRIPELQRTCQVGKEMLTIKSKDGAEFNLLMELLRGEH